MIWILLAVFFSVLPVTLCGYTNIRFPSRRKEGKEHVACVGDSITYGCTLPLFFLRRYPAVLQKLLGSQTQVAAFGVNDRTLQNNGNKPYRNEKAFRQSKDYLPDCVVILLGTNDSKDSNWISEDVFQQQYRELIAAYRALPSHPRILICTPPCAFSPVSRFFRITNDAKPERIPAIAGSIRDAAEETGSELVDLYALTEGKRELFGPDGLHPSYEGAKVIAETVCKRMKHLPGKPESRQLIAYPGSSYIPSEDHKALPQQGKEQGQD